MKKILSLLKAAREALEIAKKNLEGIKDDDLKKLAGISEELGQVREEYKKVESSIGRKQSDYFDLLAGCVTELGSTEEYGYKMSDGRSSCSIRYNGESATIYRNNRCGDWRADQLEPEVFVELSDAVIARIIDLAGTFPIDLVAEKIKLVEELKVKILQLMENDKLKVPQP